MLHPTLAVTQQYLATNKIVFKEHTPVVEDVLFNEERPAAHVYFPIEDERYYLVVTVDLEPQVSLSWVNTSAGNIVYFCVKSEVHTLDELLAITSIEPTKTWEMGKTKRVRHNGFEIKPFPKATGEVEDKLRSLITLLLPHKESLQALANMAGTGTGINIAYWGYKEQMWGIGFDEEIIQGLAALNLSVDIDLYAGGPDPVPFDSIPFP